MQIISPVSGPNYLLFKQQVIAEIYNIIYRNHFLSFLKYINAVRWSPFFGKDLAAFLGITHG